MNWYAVQCEPRREWLAHHMFKYQGFQSIFPHLLEWIGCSGAKPRLVPIPYYPGYVFVEAEDEHFGRIADTYGVSHLVQGTDRMPFPIPRTFIGWLLDKMDPLGAVHEVTASRSKYGALRGKTIKVQEGNPFWGLVGVVSEVDNTAVSVILKMLGADREIRLSVEQVAEVPHQDGRGAS